jgi:acyl-CoA synthetase (AMP-forming)/AMP-acid ligase II
MNLSHVLRQAARRLPDDIGLVWGDRQWSWRELDQRVDAMAAALVAKGVRKGDRVLVQSRNCNQLYESMFACFRVGAVWVPANFRQVPEEVASLGETSGASLLICEDVFADHATAIRARCPAVKGTIVVGEPGTGETYDELVEAHRGASVSVADVDYDDPCWFFFTSGTSGRPKAAVLTHGQMAFVVTNHLADLMPGTGSDDASLVVAPLSHGAGIHQLVQTARACKTVLPGSRSLDGDEVWRLVEKWRIRNMFTVPTILKILVEHPAVDQHDHTSLRHVIYAGAPMYRADQRRAIEKLGSVLVQYYGLGEVTGNITVLPPHLHGRDDDGDTVIGTCGVERTGMQVSVQDAQGQEVAAGETGEICVCGPAVFAGYYNNPEANGAAFRNGWFRTGDLGYLDEEGFLYITGRASDMYISGGSNIYPREIEEKLLEHPAVAEVAVLGVPDALWGEVGVAVCVLKSDAIGSGDEMLTWLEGRIARYKLPKRIHFWRELPKSGYGKVLKRVIREGLDGPSATS